MFNVERYDPKAQQEQKSRRKRKSRPPHAPAKSSSSKAKTTDHTTKTRPLNQSDASDERGTALHVIAEETKPTIQTVRALGETDEALDDFDIEAELLQVENENGDKDHGESPDQPDATLSDEVRNALNMSSLPIETAASIWKMAPFLIENLKRDGHEHFFPIQSLVIPDVIASERHGHILRVRDVCVTAPTGSGKTLAFVLPVLNALANRTVCRLRALVVLPSRDLAQQVYDVFEKYVHGSDLRVGLAIGQSNFKGEQKALILGSPDFPSMMNSQVARQAYSFDRGDVSLALEAFPEPTHTNDKTLLDDDTSMSHFPSGGASAVDVLVATPGRLIDHIDRTPGFTLQHLQFLIIDEADRLLNQSYHSFVARVNAATNEASINALFKLKATRSGDRNNPTTAILDTFDRSLSGNSFVVDPTSWRRNDTEGDEGPSTSDDTRFVTSVCRPVQLRKLLFSATLTKDPKKLSALGLVNPKYFDAHRLRGDSRSQRYSLPRGLQEFTVECTAEQKPLVLLALLAEYGRGKSTGGSTKGIMVVFTASLDSTHRLARLLQLLWVATGIGKPSTVAEFSSALSQSQRSALMKRCTGSDENAVSVVVCSDGMSRGMDLSVSCIYNYDVPTFAKTYVHRCGRTARAGREGTAISLLKSGQIGQFSKMRRLIEGPERVKEMGVKKDFVRTAVTHYRSCVRALRSVIRAENEGNLGNIDDIPTWLYPETGPC